MTWPGRNTVHVVFDICRYRSAQQRARYIQTLPIDCFSWRAHLGILVVSNPLQTCNCIEVWHIQIELSHLNANPTVFKMLFLLTGLLLLIHPPIIHFTSLVSNYLVYM